MGVSRLPEIFGRGGRWREPKTVLDLEREENAACAALVWEMDAAYMRRHGRALLPCAPERRAAA
jgi:hypothetical protein